MSPPSVERASRWRDPRLLLGLLSLALVLWLTLGDLERVSPGPLSPVHGQVAALDDGQSCDACHGGGGLLRAERTLDQACGDCHEAILADVDEERGLHGTLAEPRDCGACHVEHHGDELALVGPAAFRRAGVAELEAFDHAVVDFRLAGRHAELTCEACHPNAHVDLLPEGARRFHGLSQDCVACHDDPHEGRMQPACADCHGQAEPFAEVASFSHADFALDGAHASASCTDCHAPGTERAVERVASLPADDPRAPLPRDCAACHADPHAAGFTAGVAAQLDVTVGASCGSCHAATLPGFAAREGGTTPALHAAGGFPLEGEHAALDCSSCHAGGAFDERYAPDGAARRADDCADCHADPHAGQFETEAGPGPRACADCHTTEHFTPAAFDLAEHALTPFPLEASHADAACEACHLRTPDVARNGPASPAPGLVERRPPPDAVVRLRGQPSACEACHVQAHAPRELEGRQPEAFADCASCHLPTRFADLLADGFDHGRDAGFGLEGAHGETACEACHPRAEHPDASGRSFGRVAVAFGTPVEACATCHVDPHTLHDQAATFPVAATAAERAQGCALCHASDAFGAADGASFAFGARADFPHGRQAGFALEGAHARLACEACHVAPPPAPDEGRGIAITRRLGLVVPPDGLAAAACAACHVDPHGDGLRAEPASRDCARCHASASFAPTLAGAFDHGRETGLTLDGAHAGLECAACHVSLPEPDALGRTFAQARGQACTDCHADPHVGQFAVDGATDCARCHADDGAAARFDHQRDARFALDERHAELACAACHVPSTLRDGRVAVRYRPLGRSCVDCHGPGGGGR